MDANEGLSITISDLETTIQAIKDAEDHWYKEQIEKWIPPLVIPTVKTPKYGWKQRRWE